MRSSRVGRVETICVHALGVNSAQHKFDGLTPEGQNPGVRATLGLTPAFLRLRKQILMLERLVPKTP